MRYLTLTFFTFFIILTGSVSAQADDGFGSRFTQIAPAGLKQSGFAYGIPAEAPSNLFVEEFGAGVVAPYDIEPAAGDENISGQGVEFYYEAPANLGVENRTPPDRIYRVKNSVSHPEQSSPIITVTP